MLSIRCMSPHFDRLTHFACHTPISPASFNALSSSTQHTLQVLHMDFDYHFPESLPYFDRLSILTALSLNMVTPHDLPPRTARVCLLPKLMRLDLSGDRSGIFYAANWLKCIHPSRLHTIRLTISELMCCALLVPLFARHGHVIDTVILQGGVFRDIRYPLGKTTALETIELWGGKEVVEEMMKFDMPKGNGVVVEDDCERGCTVLRLGRRDAVFPEGRERV